MLCFRHSVFNIRCSMLRSRYDVFNLICSTLCSNIPPPSSYFQRYIVNAYMLNVMFSTLYSTYMFNIIFYTIYFLCLIYKIIFSMPYCQHDLSVLYFQRYIFDAYICNDILNLSNLSCELIFTSR